ncbi:MAG: TRAP transporter substrate-binding protein DctP [Pseudomonadota bacterium]
MSARGPFFPAGSGQRTCSRPKETANKTLRRTPSKLRVSPLTADAACATAAEAHEWRGWTIDPPSYPVFTGMAHFAEHFAARSDGEFIAKVFHSGVLNDQPDAIEQVREGALDWVVFTFDPLDPVAPEVNVTLLSFIFKSAERMHAIVAGPMSGELDGMPPPWPTLMSSRHGKPV